MFLKTILHLLTFHISNDNDERANLDEGLRLQMTNWKMTNERIWNPSSESSSDHTTIGDNNQLKALITSCSI